MKRRDFILWGMRGIIAATMADAYFFEPKWLEWPKFSLAPRASGGTPFSFIQVSDLHLKGVDHSLTEAAVKINQAKPDLVLITGDSIEGPQFLPHLDKFLSLIDHDIPKAAILGNWEYWGKVSFKELESIYAQNNCRLLVNECEIYSVKGKRVLVTGIDDFIGGNADIKTALRNFQQNDYHIVLNHCPEYRDFMFRQLIGPPQMDVILSGHTHGGQVNLLGYIPVVAPGSGRYMRGWYRDEIPAPMYVSRGIGTSLLPLRLNARPEIATFHVSI